MGALHVNWAAVPLTEVQSVCLQSVFRYSWMGDYEPMSEGSPDEGSDGEDGFGMSDGEDGLSGAAEELSSEDEEVDFEDEDDSDDILAGLGVIDGALRHGGMNSDSDIEYGREGYFYPFDNDLILNSQLHREYGSSTSYKLSVPRTGHGNTWLHVFSAALSGNTESVLRELRRMSDFGDPSSFHPTHRDFPLLPCSPEALLELKKNIGHHICDDKCVPAHCICSSSYLVRLLFAASEC